MATIILFNSYIKKQVSKNFDKYLKDYITENLGHLSSVDFTNMNLENSNLANLSLTKIKFTEILLRGSTFCESNLTSASFYKSHLRNTKFTDANLTDVTFYGADLVGANFRGALFKDTNFTKADLTRADISHLTRDEFLSCTITTLTDLTDTKFKEE
jgi:uncharacterized protein YjbI with pentapeptide repeats